MELSTTDISKRQGPTSQVLAGRTFLVTRSSDGNAIERKKLESLGAKVIELPSIEIAPPSSWKKVDGAISRLEEFDWIIFTSANGVKTFFERLKQNNPKLLIRLKTHKTRKDPRFACVGPATRRSLEEMGFRCTVQPREFLTAKLGKELAESMNVDGKNILLARAQVANRELARMLRDSGANVSEAPTYRTISRARKLPQTLIGKITDVTLTSPSTVKGLLMSVSAATIISKRICVHCIGPVTAKSARIHGLKVQDTAKVHTIDGLMKAIVDQDK